MPTTFLTVKNRATSTLNGDINSAVTSLAVAGGDGVKFPTTYPFHITIDNEILECSNVSTDTLTVTRAAEGTTNAGHTSGAVVSLNITAQMMSDLDTAVNTLETANNGVTLAQQASQFTINGGTGTSKTLTVTGNATISGTPLVNPMTTLGDIIYENATPVPDRLAGDTSNTRKFLRTLSVAGVAQAPAWDTIAIGDLPTITPTKGGTGVANGTNNTLTFTGNYTLGLTLSGNTTLTLPTSGTVETSSGVYGDGSDGAVTVSSSSGTYTGLGGRALITSGVLVADAYFTTLTINSPYILKTGGFRIFCSVSLVNNGKIDNSGGAGGNAGATYGAGGLSSGIGSLGQTANPGGRGTGISGDPYRDGAGGGGGGGVILICALTITNTSGIIQANGGAGGTGGTVTPGDSGSAANGTSVTDSLGGAGGKGGQTTPGSGGTATTPLAGDGGFRAVPMAVLLREFVSGVMLSGGGGGGGGYWGNGAQGGGGGGGGGGLLVLIYSSFSSGTETVNGGALGAGGGTAAIVGSAGTIIKIQN
jgi:hypothetical protein